MIKQNADDLKKKFGVRRLCIFGSVARDEQNENSDIDICVDMEPDMFKRMQMKSFLEGLCNCSVDVVREHKHMNPILKSQIVKDGIYVI